MGGCVDDKKWESPKDRDCQDGATRIGLEKQNEISTGATGVNVGTVAQASSALSSIL